jgi:hypothetical protein
MKITKILLGSTIALGTVCSGSVLAGSTSVYNDLKVMDVDTTTTLNVDRITRTIEQSVGTATSIKTDHIVESIVLPDGVGTKDIVTDIYAYSNSYGTINKDSIENLNLSEVSKASGFSQYVGAGASYQ